MAEHVTVGDLLAGPPIVPLWPTAGRAVGSGRRSTYTQAAGGTFPVPVLRVGSRLKVRRSDLLRFLGIEDVTVTAISAGGDAA